MSLFDKIPKTYVKEFQVGRRVDTLLKVAAVDKRTKKDGGAFLIVELMDNTGKLPAKIWNNADTFYKTLKAGDVYRVNGTITEYMSQKEVKIDGIKPMADDDPAYNEEDFKEIAAFDTNALFDELIHMIKTNIKNDHVLALTDLFVSQYSDRFKTHYGAMKIHHAYLGGLLEHTHSMMKLVIMFGDHYQLDKDVLLMGCLFHDVGKMFEFDIDPAPEATMAGGLVGHIMISTSIFQKLTQSVDGFPKDLSLKIQHLIVSHHGEKEFGSPVEPRSLEAYALHVADLLDSRMAIMNEALGKSETKGMFTDFIPTLGRRMFKE